MLLADNEWLNVEIAAELGVSIATVATYRNRFALYGVAGLRNKPNYGRPRQVDRAMIITETLKPPPAEVRLGRWTIKELGRHVGVSEATVARVWREYGLSPREDGALAFATQPGLVATGLEIVGFYSAPGVRAAALLLGSTVDGDTGSPGSERRSGNGCPAPPGGVTDHQQFVDRVTCEHPGRRIDIVVDDAAATKQVGEGNGSALRRLVRSHFTLGPDIWLRLVEVWVQMMIRDGSDTASDAYHQLELLRAGADLVWFSIAQEPGPSMMSTKRSSGHDYAAPPERRMGVG